MRISVNSKTVFRFPTCLIVNRLSVGILRRKLRKNGLKLTRKQTALFIKEFKAYKKEAPDWNLVEVTKENKDHITVKI